MGDDVTQHTAMGTFMGVNSNGTLIGLIQMVFRSVKQLLNTTKKRKFASIVFVAGLLLMLMIQGDDTEVVINKRLKKFYAKYNLSLDDFGKLTDTRNDHVLLDGRNASSRFHSSLKLKPGAKNQSLIRDHLIGEEIHKNHPHLNSSTNQNTSRKNGSVKNKVPGSPVMGVKKTNALPPKSRKGARKKKKSKGRSRKNNEKDKKLHGKLKRTYLGPKVSAKRKSDQAKIPASKNKTTFENKEGEVGAIQEKTRGVAIISGDERVHNKNAVNGDGIGELRKNNDLQIPKRMAEHLDAKNEEGSKPVILVLPPGLEGNPNRDVINKNEPGEKPKSKPEALVIPLGLGRETGIGEPDKREESEMKLKLKPVALVLPPMLGKKSGGADPSMRDKKGEKIEEKPKALVIPKPIAAEPNQESVGENGPHPAAEKEDPIKDKAPAKVPRKSLKDKYKIGAEGDKGGKEEPGKKGAEEKEEDAMVTDRQGRELKKRFYNLAPEVFDFVPKEFAEETASPCWLEEGTDETWCLPSFYVIGMPDSGSQNLWQKIAQHPAVAEAPMAGQHWWNRRRGIDRGHILESFKNYLRRGANVVEQFGKGIFNMVYGDHSTTLFWDNVQWWLAYYPGFTEAPPYTSADILRTVQPQAKLLLILTEPAVTIYRNYLVTHGHKATPKDFDERCANSIDIFDECLETKSLRTCVYQPFNPRDKTIRLQWGFLFQYFEDWLKVFPLDQFYIIEKDSFESNCLVELPTIISFLQLERLSMRIIREICQAESIPYRVPPPDSQPMQDDTKQYLESYFAPYFDKLDEVLKKQ